MGGLKWALSTGIFAICASPCAGAATFDAGSDLDISWNNTIRLGTTYQTGKTSLNYAGYCPEFATSQAGHGPCGFDSQFLSGRVDWSSELDLNYRGYGFLVSSSAWYDAVDRRKGDGQVDASELGGRGIELFDGFIHGSSELAGGQSVSFRIGRQTLIWGESRYFTQDGIAGGQAPVDFYRAQSAGGYQSGSAYLPVGQASFRWQGPDSLALEGYFQFEWRRSRVDPRDAYTGITDILGAQGNNLIALERPFFRLNSYARLADGQPGSSGQFGLAAKWHAGDYDFGLYGLRFDAKTPQIYLYAHDPYSRDFSRGGYRLEYPKDIALYGLSASGPLGAANFGVEISARRNMPLVNGSVFIPSPLAAASNTDSYPEFPTGDTLNAQLSWNYVLPPSSVLRDGAVWTGEVTVDHLIATTANADHLTPGRTRTAAGLRTVFEPQFLQVLPRLDVSFPIGLRYNFLGLSEIDPALNRGTGDVSVGVALTWDRVWKGTLGMTRYFGQTKLAPTPFDYGSSKRALSDWDFFAVGIERSF